MALGYAAGMSFRLAAYAVCIEDGRVLLGRYDPPDREPSWTLPGGGVEHGEDPFDAVVREVAGETGCKAVVERLLGVDSKVIPVPELSIPGPVPHQNAGIFYRVRITGGHLRPEPNGDTSPKKATASGSPVVALVQTGQACGITGFTRTGQQLPGLVNSTNVVCRTIRSVLGWQPRRSNRRPAAV